MNYTHKKNYDFVSKALDDDTFGVISFTGFEAMSEYYEFQINLVSSDKSLDPDTVLQNPATFTIKSRHSDVPIHGVISRFEQRQAFGKFAFYRAVLVPKMWWLSINPYSQVFVEEKLKQIIEDILTSDSCGLTTDDYRISLKDEDKYPKLPFVCQYGETHLDFIKRKMEHDGLYFFFEQRDAGERVVISNDKTVHLPLKLPPTIRYVPVSGLGMGHEDEVIGSLTCKQKILPKEVTLKDYNYMKPSLESLITHTVKGDKGHGTFLSYGDHFTTTEDGERLAKVRAEALLCREKVFTGQSHAPFLRPGYSFDLEDHYREDFNIRHLILSVRHQGNQVRHLIPDLGKEFNKLHKKPHYANTFTTIPADVQYRSERTTPIPRCYGFMNAEVDATGTGKYAELDENGKYKVIFPFDIATHEPGKASAWMHKGQPYSGPNYGMHFPLHKEAEVLLAFNDGNPDRPVIIGAIPNPKNASVVTSENEAKSIIKTAGGNMIEIDDTEKKEYVDISSPASKTHLHVGYKEKHRKGFFDDAWWNSVPDNFKNAGKSLFGKSGYILDTGGPASIKFGGGKFEVIVLEGKISINIGSVERKFSLAESESLFIGGYSDTKLGGQASIKWPETFAIDNGSFKVKQKETDAAEEVVESHEERVEVVQEQIDVNKIKQEVRDEVLGAIKEELKLIKKQISVVENGNLTIVNDFVAIQKKISTLDKQLETCNTKIENGDKKITNHIDVMNTVTHQVNTVSTKLNNLQTYASSGNLLLLKFSLMALQ